MATRLVKEGDVIDFVATAAISSDDIVAVGNVVGVAITDGAIGQKVPVQVCGEWLLPKATGTAIAVGASIDFDTSLGVVTTGLTPAAGDVSGIGIATEAAGSSATSVRVLLTPGSGVKT